jgi:hypothetical protein
VYGFIFHSNIQVNANNYKQLQFLCIKIFLIFTLFFILPRSQNLIEVSKIMKSFENSFKMDCYKIKF